MKYKPVSSKKMTLREMSVASRYGKLPADQRVQVKMPSSVVQALDKEFTDKDRSSMLTQFAIDALLAKQRTENQEYDDSDVSEEEWDKMVAYTMEEYDREDEENATTNLYTLDQGEPFIHAGDIVLSEFPYDDFRSTKVRPVLCLTETVGPYQRVIVAYIASKILSHLLTGDIQLSPDNKNFKETGLRTASLLRLHRLIAVPQKNVFKKLGHLPDVEMKVVRKKLAELFCLQ